MHISTTTAIIFGYQLPNTRPIQGKACCVTALGLHIMHVMGKTALLADVEKSRQTCCLRKHKYYY